MIRKFLNSKKGQGLVEYALILVLVAIVVMIILALLGPAIGNVFSNVVAAIENPGGGNITASVGSPDVDPVGPNNYKLTVPVTVSNETNVTLSSGGNSTTVPCNLSCAPTLSGLPSSGTYTVKVHGGKTYSGSY
jgi:pilus assembly protein Flp/PilA